MQYIFWLVVFISLFCARSTAANPIVIAAHKTTHRIYMRALVGAAHYCSATAIGPHALLTATHCEAPSNRIEIDNESARILEIIRDDFDHTIFLVSASFSDYANFAVESAVVGDDIFVFGNPSGNIDVFRKGYVAKVPIAEPVFFSPVAPTLYDFNGSMGDSGAAIFDTAGRIVGVVSLGAVIEAEGGWPSYKLMGGFPLQFATDVVKRAQTFQPSE